MIVNNTILRGKSIYLRALEPTDLEFLYEFENDCSEWNTGDTRVPYSKHLLEDYILNAHKDIYETKQLRLVISKHSSLEPIGFLDFFDFDARNRKAGIGIAVSKLFRNLGVGTQALEVGIEYAFMHLGLNQVYANIGEHNTASLKLFLKLGFEVSGHKKAWHFVNTNFVDILFLQKFNKNISH